MLPRLLQNMTDARSPFRAGVSDALRRAGVIAHALPVGPAGGFVQRLSIALWHILAWRHWVDAVAVLFFVGLSLYFHSDAVLRGQIYYEKDTWAFYLPLAQRVDAALDQGVLPLWTRALFAGFPLFADSEAGILYPLNLLFFSQLDPFQATIWRRVAAFALAGTFMFAFGRAMGFRPFAAAIAGVVFTYGSFLTSQLHHSNVLQTAIWLPLIFCGVEMGFRSYGRRRYQWFVLGGLGLGIQTLAVHPQVVMMTLLALGLFVAWRVLAGPAAVRLAPTLMGGRFPARLLRAASNVSLFVINRGFAAFSVLVLVCAAGMAIGAVQLLPLYELVQFSLRGGGVPYEFASQYSLPLGGLTQLLAPYMFKLPAGNWFIPWATWETTLYAGIPTLVLALVAVVWARNRYTWFFLGLGVLAVLLALGPNAPINLHKLLWLLPGWDSARAPGRFSFLVVFALAGLAGWGAHWLDTKLAGYWVQQGGVRWQQHWRSGWFGLWVAFLVALPVLAVYGVLQAHQWVIDFPRFALADLGIWTPRPDRFDFATFNSLSARLAPLVNLWNPSVMTSLALLQVTVLAVAGWYVMPRFGHMWKGVLLGVLAFDLLSFGAAYHPKAHAETLVETTPAAKYLAENAGTSRVIVRGKDGALEPNRFFPLGIRTLGGYSSLPPQRHLEYIAPLQEGADTFPDVLVDTAGVKYVVSPAKFVALPAYNWVSYDPKRPLVQGMKENAGSKLTLTGDKFMGDKLRVVAALRDGWDIPQDTPVAEFTVVTSDGRRQVLVMRAGREVAEWAQERPDVRANMKHAPVEVAFTTKGIDTDGKEQPQALNVSYGEMPLARRAEVTSVEYRYLENRGSVRVYGVGVYDTRGWAGGQFRTKPRYKEVYRDNDVVIHENAAALPRAYFVNRGEERKSDSSVLAEMQDRGFNPRELVLLEDPLHYGFPRPDGTAERAGGLASSRPLFRAAESVADLEATRLDVSYDAPDSGYMVITDSFYPGWRAYLDGEPVPIYRANYLFQAVRTTAGPHHLSLRYEPFSLEWGLTISLWALGLLAALVFGLELMAFVRVSATGLAWARQRVGVPAGPSPRATIAWLRRRFNNLDN